MKFTILIFLFCLLFSTNIFAGCEAEPTIENAGKILKEIKLENRRDGKTPEPNTTEIGLFIKASVKNASWQKTGAEAAVLTIFVDGKYNQDVVLFAGEKIFEYQMLLGKIDANEHKITIVLNRKYSAPNAQNVQIKSAFSARVEDLNAANPGNNSISDYFAIVNSPIIYLRPDTIGKFSDVPLLTYYEIFDEPENVKRIRYTTIFTNEDGGTQSAALMARWGRMTDIEWIYEIRVTEKSEMISEIYQAANHVTKDFGGKKFGSHPLFLDATVNNNFADAGCSALRVSPILIKADLTGGSRETVMDKNPWTYQIMAQEAIREGRINSEKLSANVIADLREYVYAEIYSEPENAAIAFEVKTGDGKTFASDSGNSSLRVNRPGYVRIALRLPPGIKKSEKITASVRCHALATGTESVCRNVRLSKIVRLDREFLPRETKIENSSKTVKAGEAAEFSARLF